MKQIINEQTNKQTNKQTWLMMLAQQWQVRGGNRPLSGLQHTVEKHNTTQHAPYTLYVIVWHCHTVEII